MAKPEYGRLEIKTLNKNRFRSSLFLVRSNVKTNSYSKSADIIPIWFTKYIPNIAK